MEASRNSREAEDASLRDHFIDTLSAALDSKSWPEPWMPAALLEETKSLLNISDAGLATLRRRFPKDGPANPGSRNASSAHMPWLVLDGDPFTASDYLWDPESKRLWLIGETWDRDVRHLKDATVKVVCVDTRSGKHVYIMINPRYSKSFGMGPRLFPGIGMGGLSVNLAPLIWKIPPMN